MVNQNPAPYTLREEVILNSGESSGRITINHKLRKSEQFHIYSVMIDVMKGNYELGNVDNDAEDTPDFTFTDIQEPFLDNRPQNLVELPLCCNPRTWEDLDLYIYDTKYLITGNPLDISIVTNKRDKNFKFATPAKISYNSEFAIIVTNNNVLTPNPYTYNWIKMVFNGSIVNMEEMAKHDNILTNEPIGVFGRDDDLDGPDIA